MKKVNHNSIEWVSGTSAYEEVFLFDFFTHKNFPDDIYVVDMSLELEKKKNTDILESVKRHPAMWSEVYSPKDELEIFEYYFEKALQESKKTFFNGITLEKEIKLLETYYEKLGFFREEYNCFDVDFSKVLLGASVKVENLMYRGSDYKRMGEKIFFCPPIRSAGEVKVLFTGINRGSIANIEIGELTPEKFDFLSTCLSQEHILPLTLQKVLYNSARDFGIIGIPKSIQISL